jgi:hypothetical protein
MRSAPRIICIACNRSRPSRSGPPHRRPGVPPWPCPASSRSTAAVICGATGGAAPRAGDTRRTAAGSVPLTRRSPAGRRAHGSSALLRAEPVHRAGAQPLRRLRRVASLRPFDRRGLLTLVFEPFPIVCCMVDFVDDVVQGKKTLPVSCVYGSSPSPQAPAPREAALSVASSCFPPARNQSLPRRTPALKITL